QQWIWDLPRDADLEPDLALLAGLLSGHQSHEESSILPQTQESMRATWTRLRSRYPSTFSAAPEDIIAWHEREAKVCEQAKQWPAAVLHLEQLVRLQPSLQAFRERLILAKTALSETPK